MELNPSLVVVEDLFRGLEHAEGMRFMFEQLPDRNREGNPTVE